MLKYNLKTKNCTKGYWQQKTSKWNVNVHDKEKGKKKEGIYERKIPAEETCIICTGIALFNSPHILFAT